MQLLSCPFACVSSCAVTLRLQWMWGQMQLCVITPACATRCSLTGSVQHRNKWQARIKKCSVFLFSQQICYVLILEQQMSNRGRRTNPAFLCLQTSVAQSLIPECLGLYLGAQAGWGLLAWPQRDGIATQCAPVGQLQIIYSAAWVTV